MQSSAIFYKENPCFRVGSKAGIFCLPIESVGCAGRDYPADEVCYDAPAQKAEYDGEYSDDRGVDIQIFAQASAHSGYISVTV